MTDWNYVQDVAKIAEEQRRPCDDPDQEFRRIVLKEDPEFEVANWRNFINEAGAWVSVGSVLGDDPIPLSREEWIGAVKRELEKLRKTIISVRCVEDAPLWFKAFVYGGRFAFEQGRLRGDGGKARMELLLLPGFLQDIMSLAAWGDEDVPQMEVWFRERIEGGTQAQELVTALIDHYIRNLSNVNWLK